MTVLANCDDHDATDEQFGEEVLVIAGDVGACEINVGVVVDEGQGSRTRATQYARYPVQQRRHCIRQYLWQVLQLGRNERLSTRPGKNFWRQGPAS